MHKFISKLSLLTLTLAAVTLLSGSTALAAKPAPAAKTPPALLGNDISWPQCNKTLPSGQAFGIVGVNDGLANNTNPCFAKELSWALQSKGGTGQPNVALYVNTANPGLQGSWWPTSNEYPAGTPVTNQYGTCAGANDAACAYIYGYAKAYDDVNSRGVSNPSSYLWWLDVETVNTWQTDKAANAADLEGMTAYFQSIGARVGLYSTNYQWGQIAGTVASTSNLNNLKSWMAGASSQSNAKSMCTTAKPLTTGSPVVLTQFVQSRLDYDYSCI
jgi:hypothetical protein